MIPSGLCVLAMGGNSLIDPRGPLDVENQFEIARNAVRPIAELLARGAQLVITHGNGPQVGFMQLRSELASTHLHEVPLDSLVADSQGSLGYMIQLALRESLARRGASRPIATIVTEVEVDAHDPAFAEPTKPIGRFYSLAEADHLKRERGWQMVEDSQRGYRRVVPSPLPRRIIQLGIVRELVRANVVVITCGGGGIPVVQEGPGRVQGIEAVIDKDHASALLARGLNAPNLIITTGIDVIYKDFLSYNPIPLHRTDVAELRRMQADGQFPPGSMGPKVQAAIDFLEGGGQMAIICRPEAVHEALAGRAGTRIYSTLPPDPQDA
jgi:carbamate kinase